MGPIEFVVIAVVLSLCAAERFWWSDPPMATRLLAIASSWILVWMCYVWGEAIRSPIALSLTMLFDFGVNVALVVRPKRILSEN